MANNTSFIKEPTFEKRILVTGGTGYIGSHTVVKLLNHGYSVSIIDNLSNSSIDVLETIANINRFKIKPEFHQIDLCDGTKLNAFFSEPKHQSFDAVIHFAGLKSVAASTKEPLTYFHNNVCGTLNLLKAMSTYGNCRRLVFSSSATVYGDPTQIPIPETAQLSPTNPYGKTKLQIEEILRETAKGRDEWRFVILRYFNPIGAHESGLLGENPVSHDAKQKQQGVSNDGNQRPPQSSPNDANNLVPYITKVLKNEQKHLTIFGDDYKTVDGTGVRDYVHVVDVANAHVAALNSEKGGVFNVPAGSCDVFNIGNGQGMSVKELVTIFEKVTGKTIPFQVTGRRSGDIATSVADPTKASSILGFRTKFSVEDAVKDTVRWMGSKI